MQTVIFRKFKDGEIIALFPYEIWHRTDIMSYLHIGQHGAACYNGVVRTTKPAKPNEFKDLYNELKQIGYKLEVKQKYNHNKFLTAWKKAANIN